jgi:NAD(P)-dependent dehydrogenase (short-subunit alcohol dehydrogenase family)
MTAIVVGASRGLGHGVATALAEAGAPVVAVSRTAAEFPEPVGGSGAFHWLREALLKPLSSGSRVIVFSSGAAVNGSPLSGGYAGAKATQRFITAYAQDEAERAGLDITFTALLPRITPLTDLGRPAVEAYAARAGQPFESYVEHLGPPVTPEIAGGAALELVRADTANVAPAYMLTGAGLKRLP